MSKVLADAFQELANPEGAVRGRNFPVASNNFIQRKKDAMKRKDRAAARKLIRPENADAIVDLLPAAGDTLHGITCGDFVMGDLIGRVVVKKGAPRRITISTLSLSVKNVEMFAGILAENEDLEVELLVSHYFQSTNGEIFTAIEALLCEKYPDRFRVAVDRSHAKVLIFDFEEEKWVFETSANLRSSNNIEQFTVSNCPELLDFHRGWILELMNKPAAGEESDAN